MFKSDFKYYKSKKPPPQLSNVLDFNSDNFIAKVRRLNANVLENDFFGLIPAAEWQIFEIIDNPGLIFIRNPFTNFGQRYWILRSIKDYSKTPNKTNLDTHDVIPKNMNWWDYSQTNEKLLTKLRWTTLGYHHNWDTKIYSEKSKNDFPLDLSELCMYFAKVLNFDYFNAEAAIINYYHMDSTLSGHTDHSELYLEAPLFSFSFGQTAIFLIGGRTIDVKPTALFLKSGDVVVMTKDSRLCYHGVPRIVPCSQEKWNQIQQKEESINFIDNHVCQLCFDDIKWKQFDEYIKYSRININVRQVLKKGQSKLDSSN